ncbi:MAG: hypothetical protein BAJALOKI3v1_130052 [Promethearchaeota archaeon]|jgi:uncharacterized protein YuzE|nr:MAG: hypothetical protein BAJALOKI3v1_130052 [Candidatus Lokiarchaeota archaeon]
MDFNYDKVANALYFRLTYQEIYTTEEISEDILVDYDNKGKIVGIEILNFTQKNLNLNNLILMNEDEIVSNLVKC